MHNSSGLKSAPIPGVRDLEVGWSALFPPSSRVTALPTWRYPRVLIAADTIRLRWLGSGYYPAFRPAARIYRVLLRAKAAGGLGSVRFTSASPHASLAEFIQELLPGATADAVMIGMPGTAQKLVARLTDSPGHVVGYLKCATRSPARRLLRHEYRILKKLPPGAGPAPLGYRNFDEFAALLLAPLSGKTLSAALPPPIDLSDFTATLATTSTTSLERHPWMRSVAHWCDPHVEASFAALSQRNWPIVMQHGDLAPWNVFRTSSGRLAAIDWEYGRSTGFPGLDLAQYLLQVACLCHRWSPNDSRDYAIFYLTAYSRLSLVPAEAGALVTLAAYSAYQLAVEHGHGHEDPTQRWRRAVWEAAQ